MYMHFWTLDLIIFFFFFGGGGGLGSGHDLAAHA